MSKEYLSFKKDSPEAAELLRWWQSLNSERGERAVLRRSHNLAEVVFSPAYHRLRLAISGFGKLDEDGLALVAGLVSRIKPEHADNSANIAEQMATGKSDGSARVSGLRFRRLLKVKEREELFTALTRIIDLLGGTANIQSLAHSAYSWNDFIRKQWAIDYYSKSPNEV